MDFCSNPSQDIFNPLIVAIFRGGWRRIKNFGYDVYHNGDAQAVCSKLHARLHEEAPTKAPLPPKPTEQLKTNHVKNCHSVITAVPMSPVTSKSRTVPTGHK